MRLRELIYFILMSALVYSPLADSNTGATLSAVNVHRRAQYAQRFLGSDDFRRLADLNGSGVALERVVLDHVRTAKKRLTQVQALALTEVIIRESNKFKLDPLFVLAIIEQESRFNPMAVGLHGEIGLMQIMPETALWTAKKFGLDLAHPRQLHDPIINVRVGIRYLSWLSKKFENVRYSAAAYNMGVKNVQRLLANKRQPKIYVSQVLERYKRLYAETAIRADLNNKKFVAYAD